MVFLSMLIPSYVCVNYPYIYTRMVSYVERYIPLYVVPYALPCLSVDIYSRLSLSGNTRNSLKYFEISVLRSIRFAELRGKMKLEIY